MLLLLVTISVRFCGGAATANSSSDPNVSPSRLIDQLCTAAQTRAIALARSRLLIDVGTGAKMKAIDSRAALLALLLRCGRSSAKRSRVTSARRAKSFVTFWLSMEIFFNLPGHLATPPASGTSLHLGHGFAHANHFSFSARNLRQMSEHVTLQGAGSNGGRHGAI